MPRSCETTMADVQRILAIPAIANILWDEAEEHRLGTLARLKPGVTAIVNRAFAAKDEAGCPHTVTANSSVRVIGHDLEFFKDMVDGNVTVAVVSESGSTVNLTIAAKDCDFRLLSDAA